MLLAQRKQIICQQQQTTTGMPGNSSRHAVGQKGLVQYAKYGQPSQYIHPAASISFV